MRSSIPRWTLAAALCAAGTGMAVEAGVSPEEAARLFRLKEWQPALAAYEALARAEPDNVRYRTRLGLARLELGNHEGALEALEAAAAKAPPCVADRHGAQPNPGAPWAR